MIEITILTTQEQLTKFSRLFAVKIVPKGSSNLANETRKIGHKKNYDHWQFTPTQFDNKKQIALEIITTLCMYIESR